MTLRSFALVAFAAAAAFAGHEPTTDGRRDDGASVAEANAAARPLADFDDLLIADFEGDDYGDWIVEGEAFGRRPAVANVSPANKVTGYQGRGLVNSYRNGDRTTGTLTSPPFTIRRKRINFLIGAGDHEGETCMNLLVDGTAVRTAVGVATKNAQRQEIMVPRSWDVAEFVGKQAVLQIVDKHTGRWGHINVDQIVQADSPAGETVAPKILVALERKLVVSDSHLVVPVANAGERMLLGIFDGDRLVQNFTVTLPSGDAPYWLTAYPLAHFDLTGKEIRVAPVDGKKRPEDLKSAFDLIRIGSASDGRAEDDYARAYRDQFHLTTRRGWNNDPNGMVYHDGQYHVFYQHNPFGIRWGNMHWGHFVSTDLVHWKQKPIALFQKTTGDMMFSGGGFVDFNNSAGLGKDTLFVAFTSTGRGECLAYSKDGGLTFTELEENPVVEHKGRDPKIIWNEPEKKWVMAVFDFDSCTETEAVPPSRDFGQRNSANIAFWESKDLRQWTRTGAFTDPDRNSVWECPELFELPVQGESGEKRWVLYGAQNRCFVGSFDGKTFRKESGPHGIRYDQPGVRPVGGRGSLYAAQTFSNVPDGRRIQMGWVRTSQYVDAFPDQIYSQAFSLPHELTLRRTDEGVRLFYEPVSETEQLRVRLLSDSIDGLSVCAGELSEVVIEFGKAGRHELTINGIDASFTGTRARIFTDRNFNELYIDGGLEYRVTKRDPAELASSRTAVTSDSKIRSLQVYRLKPIWPGPAADAKNGAPPANSPAARRGAGKSKPLPNNASPVPRFSFAETLEEQERQLANNPLLERFRKSRQEILKDRHHPLFHFTSPENRLNDPNGLSFWNGQWHMFYQGYPPEHPRQHWGHAVSNDLIHWRDLPYAIYPGPERASFSGSVFIEDGRAIAMYHGTEVGTMVATSSDPLLLNWKKVTGRAVIPYPPPGEPQPEYNIFDPCIWKHGDWYYALTAGPKGGLQFRSMYLHRSKDLATWEHLHEFLENDRFSLAGDDGACPYFWPIGTGDDRKHILLHFSHMSGGKYMLGDYDTQRDKFVVDNGGDFNFGAWGPCGLHAPSAYPDGAGGVVVIFNVNEGKPTDGWNRMMSLPRRLTLRPNGTFNPLHIEPAGDVESLRGEHLHVGPTDLPANQEVVLENVRGDAMELVAEIAPQTGQTIELNVLRSPGGEEVTRIQCFRDRGLRIVRRQEPTVVSIDTSRSTTAGDVLVRPPETAQVEMAQNEPLTLRVFIDRSIVEVFVNGRQCVTARVYPDREDSLGVSLRAQGKAARLTSLNAWQMKSVYE